MAIKDLNEQEQIENFIKVPYNIRYHPNPSRKAILTVLKKRPECTPSFVKYIKNLDVEMQCTIMQTCEVWNIVRMVATNNIDWCVEAVKLINPKYYKHFDEEIFIKVGMGEKYILQLLSDTPEIVLSNANCKIEVTDKIRIIGPKPIIEQIKKSNYRLNKYCYTIHAPAQVKSIVKRIQAKKNSLLEQIANLQEEIDFCDNEIKEIDKGRNWHKTYL